MDTYLRKDFQVIGLLRPNIIWSLLYLEAQAAIAHHGVQNRYRDCLTLFGPGRTTRARQKVFLGPLIW